MLPWEAERSISADQAGELISGQFPDLAGLSVEPFGSGWDNTAFLAGGRIVFRFPRKAMAVAFLETEARVLPLLAPRLPLPVPSPRWIGAASERFPWPFAGYERLDGVTACAVDLSDAERVALAPALAAFLRALHAVPPEGLGLPGDTMKRTDFQRRIPVTVERLRALESLGRIEDGAPWLRILEGGNAPPPERAVPVHGDLYARHLLVSAERRLCGVIDWGDTHAGDPGLDIGIAFGFLHRAARDAFLRAYGPIDERTQRVARMRAAFHGVAIAWFAHSIGDAGLLREGLFAMRNVFEA